MGPVSKVINYPTSSVLYNKSSIKNNRLLTSIKNNPLLTIFTATVAGAVKAYLSTLQVKLKWGVVKWVVITDDYKVCTTEYTWHKYYNGLSGYIKSFLHSQYYYCGQTQTVIHCSNKDLSSKLALPEIQDILKDYSPDQIIPTEPVEYYRSLFQNPDANQLWLEFPKKIHYVVHPSDPIESFETMRFIGQLVKLLYDTQNADELLLKYPNEMKFGYMALCESFQYLNL